LINSHINRFKGQNLVESLCESENIGDGLISKMMAEELDRNMIERILIDFIIAAGDTVFLSIRALWREV
jgi:hypothetical protein